MKKKIILSFTLLFLISAGGGVFSMLYIRNITQSLEQLIQLHQIEDFRQNLVMSVQTVQADLYTVNTMLGQKVDAIAENVSKLEENAQKCTGCHHSPEMTKKLEALQAEVKKYEDELSHYITMSANKRNIDKVKGEAAVVGNRLLEMTEQMSIQASKHLEDMTAMALVKISRVQTILVITMFIACCIGGVISMRLTRFITRPVTLLVNATNEIARGDLGYTINYEDETEFGELSRNFNAMSQALKAGYAELEKEVVERTQAQAELVKSGQFLTTIFDSIRDPFCIIDTSYKIVRFNDAYAALKNKTADELMGKVCYEILTGGTEVCDRCVLQETVQNKDTRTKEKMVPGPEGEAIWLAIYTYPILDNEGNVTHVIEYTRDITERKRTEEALRVSEERYALAAQGANDGLWDWNLLNNSMYYSPRWKTMIGYDELGIRNNPDEWFSRVHDDDREQLEVKIRAHIQNPMESLVYEYRIKHVDGTYRWMLCRGIAKRDREGRAYRLAGSQTDITARKMTEEQLIHDAFHDALTGLPNRALLMDRLAHVINSSKRLNDFLYAVLFIDLDRFKVINDSLGHIIGDKLLVEAAGRLSESVRPGDTVARLGGDEFAIILENIRDGADVSDVADRIQSQITPPFHIGEQDIYVTVSMGIALKSLEYERPEQVLRDADIAMYQAKVKGKARYEFFESTMHSNVVERLQLEADLRQAVEQKQGFLMHYQPIIDLKSGKLQGFEALIRWIHPKKGIIRPLDFIPIAEETGMIIPIGEFIIREVIRQLKEWQEKYHTDTRLKMSFNVSSKQFHDPAFADTLAAIIKEVDVDPASLAIEVTESIIMENTETAIENMKKVREMGVHIHIDDFGTGYSSLSYLHHFPVHALKIDRSFIERMANSDEDKEIVRTIILLAQNLNMEVIAEGIEEENQLSGIRNMDCHYAQGYFIARPMAPESLEVLLQRDKLVALKKTAAITPETFKSMI